MGDSYERHGTGVKASFDHIYDLDDPRGYFNTLGKLDYQSPQHGSTVFSSLLKEMKLEGRPAKVLDLCCSYGVNAALLKHEICLDDLYSRYKSDPLASLSSDELAAEDAKFYEERSVQTPPEVVGVDVAGNAVTYALRAGLLDEGFAEDLESEEPSVALKEAVSGTDMVTVTGGIGYVWENTFDRVLSCLYEEDMPWVATMPLRMVDYAPLSGLLAEHGLATEKLTGRTFQQRQFFDDREREQVLGQLEAADIDSTGKEDTGWYHSELYLSRPAEDVDRMPLQEFSGIAAAV